MSEKIIKKGMKEFHKCVSPIFLGNGEKFYRSATMTFYSHPLSKNPIGITNYHVYKEFLKEQKSKKIGTMLVPNFKFDLEERLIDFNEKHDLATFKITKEELLKIDKSSAIQKVPLLEIPGENVGIIVGYPKMFRVEEKNKVGFLSLYCEGVPIEYSKNKNFTINKEKIRQMEIEEYAAKKENFDLENAGGMSGSGVFAYGVGKDEQIIPILLGVIKEDSSLCDSIIGVSINKINSDGSITN